MKSLAALFAVALLMTLTALWMDHGAKVPQVPLSTVAKVAGLDLPASVVASAPGCNATSFAQLPDDPSLFIGRQLVTADGKLAGVDGANDCSGGDRSNEAAGRPFNRWGLVLDSFDWRTKRFRIVKPLIDTSLDPRTHRSRAMITAGPMRGLIIRSAYDASAVKFRNSILVAFECTFENGAAFHVGQTSSCLAGYDPVKRSIDMNRATVVVTGDKAGDTVRVASLPRLLAFRHKLYVYWAASVVIRGRILRSPEQGAELSAEGAVPSVRGSRNGVANAFDRASTEVWAPEDSQLSNRIASIMSFAPAKDGFLIFGALGGSACQAPSDRAPGCFRLVVKRSNNPLAPGSFNAAQSIRMTLPTNPQEYALPVVDPAGRWWVLAHFARPVSNGYAERDPAPSGKFWAQNDRSSALTLIPAQLPN